MDSIVIAAIITAVIGPVVVWLIERAKRPKELLCTYCDPPGTMRFDGYSAWGGPEWEGAYMLKCKKCGKKIPLNKEDAIKILKPFS